MDTLRASSGSSKPCSALTPFSPGPGSGLPLPLPEPPGDSECPSRGTCSLPIVLCRDRLRGLGMCRGPGPGAGRVLETAGGGRERRRKAAVSNASQGAALGAVWLGRGSAWARSRPPRAGQHCHAEALAPLSFCVGAGPPSPPGDAAGRGRSGGCTSVICRAAGIGTLWSAAV